MRSRWMGVTTVCLVWGMLVSGCGWIEGGLGEKKEAKSAKEDRQELHITIASEPPSLDSAIAVDGSSFNVLNNVMEGLMRLDMANQVQPAISDGMPEISPDKKTITFKIREGAKWSDGVPVKAQDFEYAWKRALNPNFNLESAVMLFDIENAQAYHTGQAPEEAVGVKALDDRTLQVKLRQPSPYFLGQTASAAFLPQRKDIVEKYGKEYGSDKEKMVYNGPFVLAEWNHEQNLRYKKNDQYWDKKSVKLEQVHVKVDTDPVNIMNGYTSGKTDVAPLSKELVDAFKGGSEFLPVERGATFLLVYNTRLEFLKNKKIRQALSLAVDREQLVNEVMKDGSRPAKGMVPDGIDDGNGDPFRKDAGKLVDFDKEKASRLLEEGIDELGYETLPTVELNVNDDDRKKIALFLKNEWKNNLGLNVTINPKPVKQKLAAEQQGYFHLSLVRWIGRYNDPMAFMEIGHSASQVNFGKWHNPAFDRLIEKAKSTSDFKARNEAMVKAEEIVMEDAGVAPLFYESQAYVQKPYVKNLFRHPIGPEYTLKWTYIEGKEQQKKKKK
ncbi:peptide ABC transporter substrate-binding protein [Salinithrix halophila]|uniref:Peptide ABC transporter substrate-binding protein n=1 Tax=Salinithrix halophila TaxID=1485204 RepID=A0ABV8JG86_9BACL